MTVMNPYAAAARYKGVQVQTCSPVQLLVMLYDGILQFCSEAQTAIANKERARSGERIGRALKIVSHLSVTLMPEHAPELADNLLAVYGFCSRRLVEANLEQSPEKLTEVMNAITPIRDGFAEAKKLAA